MSRWSVLAMMVVAGGCASSSGLRTEADMTERHIATYREGIRLGCVEGTSEDQREHADAVCACVLAAIDTAIGEAGWRKASFHGWRREFEAEKQVMAPAIPAIDACADGSR